MTGGPRPGPVLAIVGATGAVGTVMREVLSSRADIWGEIRLIASARSAGRMLPICGEQVMVKELAAGSGDRRPFLRDLVGHVEHGDVDAVECVRGQLLDHYLLAADRQHPAR